MRTEKIVEVPPPSVGRAAFRFRAIVVPAPEFIVFGPSQRV
jgi:hypothetical protein